MGKPTPLGLPRAALSNTGEMNLISKKPIRVGAVTLQAFDGYQSVKTDAGVYPIADDVPVFVSRTNQLITLRQAKADYDAFVLYADAPLSSVKTDAGVYPIADDVPVFVSRTNQLITLRQAKADYDAFVLYADAPLSEGCVRPRPTTMRLYSMLTHRCPKADASA